MHGCMDARARVHSGMHAWMHGCMYLMTAPPVAVRSVTSYQLQVYWPLRVLTPELISARVRLATLGSVLCCTQQRVPSLHLILLNALFIACFPVELQQCRC